MNNNVIIALDVASFDEAKELLENFRGETPFVKIGLELYCTCGNDILKYVKSLGMKIFLDLKLHDIPNTVGKTIETLCKNDIDILTIHAAGGSEMIKRSALAVQNSEYKPLLLAITQLTSTTEEMLHEEQLIQVPLSESVLNYALLAKNNGADGIVCSAHEAELIKANCGTEFVTVVPGIRMEDDDVNDQKRIVTPAQAKEKQCDYIVVGRSITTNENKLARYKQIVKDFGGNNE